MFCDVCARWTTQKVLKDCIGKACEPLKASNATARNMLVDAKHPRDKTQYHGNGGFRSHYTFFWFQILWSGTIARKTAERYSSLLIGQRLALQLVLVERPCLLLSLFL